MKILKNISLAGSNNRPFLLDIFYQPSNEKKKVVLMAHGFKGFKDWGIWDLCAKEFAKAGFIFIKFNFSHNGTGLKATSDFTDLTAFGENNFSRELEDIDHLTDWITTQDLVPKKELDLDNLSFIGHSRGGGIGIIAALLNTKIKSLVTWSSVDDLAFMWRDNLQMIEEWRKNGVHFIMNGRTKQQMPLYFQFYSDWEKNEAKYDIPSALAQLDKPMLIVHGDEDPAVPYQAAKNLSNWAKNSQLVIVKGADHVFRGSHPYTSDELPFEALQLLEASIRFLK